MVYFCDETVAARNLSIYHYFLRTKVVIISTYYADPTLFLNWFYYMLFKLFFYYIDCNLFKLTTHVVLRRM